MRYLQVALKLTRLGPANSERSETMEKKTAFPSHEFGQSAKEALAKAQTVALPGPTPARGKLYLGINPDFIDRRTNPALPSGDPAYFLRLVQVVSQKVMVTRILDLKELRGVSLPLTTPAGDSREFRTVNEITDKITDAINALTKAASTKREEYEVCLFEDAVIYVHESAPVFLQVQYEFGVSAFEAVDHVDTMQKIGCPCPTDLSPVVVPCPKARAGTRD
jgi:hypothetical protein